jgi:hypothetical protein
MFPAVKPRENISKGNDNDNNAQTGLSPVILPNEPIVSTRHP